MEKPINEKVKDYYDTNQILYTLIYSLGTNSLHYGFWDENTKSTKESLLNSNKFIMNCLEIKKGEKILDAGCGVGGTAVYIAEKTGARVSGITISAVQLKEAKRNAAKSSVAWLLDFSLQDYTKTNFRQGSFSKIYGQESICYARKKIDFMKEAYRLLKKKGILVVADGFMNRNPLTENEKVTYQKWLRGWALDNIATVEGFRKDLEKTGFKDIKFYDKHKEIRHSRDRIYVLGILGYPIIWILSKLGIINKKMYDHTIACICQKSLFSDENPIVTYGVFVARKQ